MNSSLIVTRILNTPRKLGQFVVISGAAAFFAGCASEPDSHVVSAPPPSSPVIVQQQPSQIVIAGAAQLPAGTVVVTQAPPALQTEVAQARPSSDHVWVPGYWTWRNNRYEWMAGHWEVPPRTNAVWVSPRWERLADGSYRFYEGFWE